MPEISQIQASATLCTNKKLQLSLRYRIGWGPQLVCVWWHREKSAQKCTLAFAVLTKQPQLYLKVNGLVHSIGQIYLVNCASEMYRMLPEAVQWHKKHSKTFKGDSDQSKKVNCLSQEVSALHHQHIDRRRSRFVVGPEVYLFHCL